MTTDIKARCSRYVYQIILVLLVSVFGAVPVAAQWGRQPMRAGSNPIAKAAGDMNTALEKILQDYVLTGQELDETGKTTIEAKLEDWTSRYFNSFTPEDKAKLHLLKAYIGHYNDNPETIFKELDRAIRLAPQDTDVSDSYILLGLYWGKYDKVKKQLKERKGGVEASANAVKSHEEMMKQVEVAGESDRGALGGRMTNQGTSTRGSQGWDFLTEEPEPTMPTQNYVSSPNEPGRPTATASSRSSRSSGGDRGPGLGVGMGLGGMAPVDPMYVQNQSSSSPGTRNPHANQYSYRSNTRKAILNLPIDYMPSASLGSEIEGLQLASINDSVFQYKGGSGKSLCALLWTIPTGSEGRGRIGGYSPRSSYGMGGMSGGRGDRQNTGFEPPSFEASFDVNTSFEQFAKLFAFYQLRGAMMGTADKIEFVGINFNPVTMRTQMELAEMVTENPMPWATCMFHDPKNRSQLDPKNGGAFYAASPVMLMTDPAGKVCYVGPVGGVLPRMLIAKNLESAATEQTAGGGLLPGGGASESAGFLSRLLGFGRDSSGSDGASGASDGGMNMPSATGGGSQQSTVTQQSGGQRTQPNTGTTMSTGYVELRPEEKMDAERKLQMAETSRKTRMYSRALDFCDYVLQKYPNSLEAEKAKQMIKDILENDRARKRDRERAGKYTGDE